ncbi:uncharacterized protein [Palaemon carinicauda]|uniref:uncharacterized protein n=1 Tax=Palaemon carinicauda TaxID=392227 RepID=UPI0035B67380
MTPTFPKLHPQPQIPQYSFCTLPYPEPHLPQATSPTPNTPVFVLYIPNPKYPSGSLVGFPIPDNPTFPKLHPQPQIPQCSSCRIPTQTTPTKVYDPNLPQGTSPTPNTPVVVLYIPNPKYPSGSLVGFPIPDNPTFPKLHPQPQIPQCSSCRIPTQTTPTKVYDPNLPQENPNPPQAKSPTPNTLGVVLYASLPGEPHLPQATSPTPNTPVVVLYASLPRAPPSPSYIPNPKYPRIRFVRFPILENPIFPTPYPQRPSAGQNL